MGGCPRLDFCHVFVDVCEPFDLSDGSSVELRWPGSENLSSFGSHTVETVRGSSTPSFLRVQVRDGGLIFLPQARASSRRGYDPDGSSGGPLTGGP
ncbi:hypothetical protein EVAR_10650_1 [Eumeta japonica]|uniref:Uncharacterized protein n=1 Tax=Eumeta variegata TaxID=151549 RepID=A0A4C1U749_EUMVA|nr:hypothetical protein EVAR_10650_1 [Eumeta japonica]